MAKFRTGISGSSWADEMPTIREIEDPTEHFKRLAEKAEERKKSGKLTDGNTIGVELDSDGNGTVEVTEVVDDGVDNLIGLGYVCEACKDDPDEREDCSECHGHGVGGSSSEGDRFVSYIGPENTPVLCVTRYYEPQDEEG